MASYTFTIIKAKGEIKKTLEEITKEDSKNKKSLGTGSGIDLSHCIYLGAKYCNQTKDFLKDVKYYRICPPEEHPKLSGAITVQFYK